MDDKIKSALDAAGTAADYSARATYQRGYDAGLASVEAREWALGVQVVAQAQRLRLADDLAKEARGVLAGADPVYGLADALAKWSTVPGMEP